MRSAPTRPTRPGPRRLRPLPGLVALGLGLALLAVTGCTQLQELAALARVDFEIDRTSDGILAGVRLDRIRSYRDLDPRDLLAIGAAVQRGELPLELTLHLDALNPADNGVAARLVDLDWTLYLEGKRTIDGSLGREYLLPPGEPVDIPLAIELDLLRFYRDNARDLAELALSLAGQGGSPKEIELRARPTISTPLGPVTYPEELVITSRSVG